MKQYVSILSILSIAVIHLSCLGQTDTRNFMKLTTLSVLDKLKHFDTSGILEMYDTSFADMNNKYKRESFKEEVLDDCQFMQKILSAHHLDNDNEIIFSTDSLMQANIASILLFDKADSGLNLENCHLVVVFYPDGFNVQPNTFLRFYIGGKAIRSESTNEVKLPPPLKN